MAQEPATRIRYPQFMMRQHVTSFTSPCQLPSKTAGAVLPKVAVAAANPVHSHLTPKVFLVTTLSYLAGQNATRRQDIRQALFSKPARMTQFTLPASPSRRPRRGRPPAPPPLHRRMGRLRQRCNPGWRRPPTAVQSMTNTDTADIEGTVTQVAALARADPSLSGLPSIAPKRRPPCLISVTASRNRCHVPLIGDFHYIGHKLLADHPACAEALDKYRINPGNVGFRTSGQAIWAHY